MTTGFVASAVIRLMLTFGFVKANDLRFKGPDMVSRIFING
jgi:hypothetical protein